MTQSLPAVGLPYVEPNENAPIFTNAANDLDAARAGLLRALRDHQDDGPRQRAIFLAHGVTATIAAEALKLEWGRLKDPGIAPGMEPKACMALAAVVIQHNRDAKALAGIWRELRAFLAGEADACTFGTTRRPKRAFWNADPSTPSARRGPPPRCS